MRVERVLMLHDHVRSMTNCNRFDEDPDEEKNEYPLRFFFF